jgi:hypothetical protein
MIAAAWGNLGGFPWHFLLMAACLQLLLVLGGLGFGVLALVVRAPGEGAGVVLRAVAGLGLSAGTLLLVAVLTLMAFAG